MRRIRHRTI